MTWTFSLFLTSQKRTPQRKSYSQPLNHVFIKLNQVHIPLCHNDWRVITVPYFIDLPLVNLSYSFSWHSYHLWAMGKCKWLKSQLVDLSKGKTNRPEEEVYIFQCLFCCYPCPVYFVIIHVWFVLLPSMWGKRPSIPYPSSRDLREPFS